MSGHGKRGRGGGHGGGGGGHGGWLVTYADLLTLLMVLFLVLWVISQIDLKKFEKFKEGLGDFGNPAAEKAKDAAAAASAAAASTTTTIVSGEGTMTADGQLTGAGLNQLAETVQEAIDLSGLKDTVTVTQTDQGLVISLSTDDILFESGSASILSSGVDVLSVLTPALNGFNNHILVAGHTDKRPLKRAGYDNWDLSVDRAISVVKLLRDRFGLSSDRLSATGYGENRPIAEGDDPASLAKNRRVEIVVLAASTPTDGSTAPATDVAPPEDPANVGT